jgi:primosomal protein N' (replication factor Y)
MVNSEETAMGAIVPQFSLLAEPGKNYPSSPALAWVSVLVDCPGAQGLFTYRLPAGMDVQPGDVLSVPFGAQHIGAIAIDLHSQPPDDFDPTLIKDVEAILHPCFFPADYWQLLQQVATYYHTPLMQVVRVALPPGLLARSQRRVKLVKARGEERGVGGDGEDREANNSPSPPAQSSSSSPPVLPDFPPSPVAQRLLALLQSSKSGDYSWQYLQRQISGAGRGIQELQRLGWVESYLEPPSPPRPKLRQVVTLVSQSSSRSLTPRQQEILVVLQRQGGEMFLNDLLQHCQTSTTTLRALADKGYVVIQAREMLRRESSPVCVPDQPKHLTPDQISVLEQIQQLQGFRTTLLHGVTGSGKTEVYLQAIAPVLERSQSALVLVPEIGLTPQLTDRFRARFGDRVCVYHSALSEGERYDTWRQMLNGQPQVVIGTRSAVFAPLPQLGLIILDEEHDSSFKQDQPAPCYHARAIAHWRAEFNNCPLVLGSATPSLESWVAVGADSLYLSLPQRIHAQPMPPVEIVDMRQELQRGNRSIFSQSLREALEQLRERQQQGILFIHRRGHSTFVSCRSCGYVVTCPDCDVSLAYHQVHADAVPCLRCHYCNYSQSVPTLCPTCNSTYFKHFGSGTQRVAQELAQAFPDLRLIRFDSDTTRTKGAHRSLLTRFANHEADLLIGTQMLTKGIDLPQVTLVGVVAADGLLHLSDYRASERAFQTLTQVSGRCGRGSDPGRVILQTYSPEHPVIEAVQRQDYRAFAETELAHRMASQYPPYCRLVLLRLSSLNPVTVQKAADRVASLLHPLRAIGADILGPVPATILRVARRYRWHILLKLPQLQDFPLPPLDELQSVCPTGVSLTLDVDPLHI